MGFKENLRMLRKSKGMTQEEFGKLINKTLLTVSRYENGTIFPTQNTLKEIAEKLEVPIQQLLSSQEISDIEKREKIFKEWDRKLSRDIMILEYLTEYLKENGYTIKSSDTEMILKKDDCYIEISHEDFSKICEELNNYFLFLISKYKTQK